MSYPEGLVISLAAGCILALEQRRWLLAGVLAGFATAAGPDALALVPACLVCAARELGVRGWSAREARRSLLAPVLSLTGIFAFALFLWAWTGTPLATLHAQSAGWGESTDALALPHQVEALVHEISFTHFDRPTINLNIPVGLLGVVILIIGLVLLARRPGRVSLPAIAWTVGIAFLTLTSEFVQPNPRMLITAFPAVIVWVQYVKGRRYWALVAVNVVLLAFLSALTFVGFTLRP